MKERSEQLLQEVLGFFRSNYDITDYDLATKESSASVPVVAKGEYHARSEQYVLSKKATLWATEQHDYVYFVSVEQLGEENYHNFIENILKEGREKVKPGKDHMYSYVTLIILAEDVDSSIKRRVSGTHFHKDFRWGFHGWMDLRVAVVSMDAGNVFTNRLGRDLKKMLLSALEHSKEERK